jgi:hypothetical protein
VVILRIPLVGENILSGMQLLSLHLLLRSCLYEKHVSYQQWAVAFSVSVWKRGEGNQVCAPPPQIFGKKWKLEKKKEIYEVLIPGIRIIYKIYSSMLNTLEQSVQLNGLNLR